MRSGIRVGLIAVVVALAGCPKPGPGPGADAGPTCAAACETGTRCNPATGQCESCAETDTAFCQRMGKQCGAAQGDDLCGVSRSVGECGPCASGACNASGACEAIAGDNCTSPIALTFDGSGAVTVQGNNTGAADDARSARCSAGGSGDLVYSFTLSEASLVDVTLAFDDPNVWPVLYLRSDCATESRDTEPFCAENSTGEALPIKNAYLTAGTWFVWVDAYGSDAGAFTLQLQKHAAPSAATNDHCESAQVLTFTAQPNGTSLATVQGNTVVASDDGKGTCGGSSGNDVVYALMLTQPMKVEVAVGGGDTEPKLDPVVYLRSDCALRYSELFNGCATADYGAPSATLAFDRVAPGTYYLVVDSWSQTSAGSFKLDVTLSAPPASAAGDSCTGMPTIDLSANATASATGTTLGASDDFSATCNRANGGDLVYAFTLSSDAKVTATVEADANTAPNYAPAVTIRSGCPGSGSSSELTCAVGSYSATATVNHLGPGTYYVVVDGQDGSGGDFTLTLTREAAVTGPANESCASVQALTFSGNTATASGSTVGAVNEADPSCGGWLSADVVYSFQTTEAHKITATVTPTNAADGFTPAITISRTCETWDRNDEAACVSAASENTPASAVLSSAAAGTYFVWVEGATGESAGAFALSVALDAPAGIENDRCDAPIALTLGAAAVGGDTSNAVNDYGSGLVPDACDTAGELKWEAPDLVYRYQPAQDGPFTVTVTPDAGFDAAVFVTEGNCGEMRRCVGSSDYGMDGAAEAVTVAGKAGTSYFIVVDGYNQQTKGAFTIEVN